MYTGVYVCKHVCVCIYLLALHLFQDLSPHLFLSNVSLSKKEPLTIPSACAIYVLPSLFDPFEKLLGEWTSPSNFIRFDFHF